MIASCWLELIRQVLYLQGRFGLLMLRPILLPAIQQIPVELYLTFIECGAYWRLDQADIENILARVGGRMFSSGEEKRVIPFNMQIQPIANGYMVINMSKYE